MIKRSGWEAVLKLLGALKAQHPQDYVEKVVVCYGDFRQIPPVLPRGSHAQIVDMSVRSSPTWAAFNPYHLQTVHRQANDAAYSKWLDALGDGSAPANHV